ncbi:MAG: hypothetical protein GY849_01420 [Deltaproteobacteria bacterium]|nr:hypothetical protein [Deltaproteobacteria bacterium]
MPITENISQELKSILEDLYNSEASIGGGAVLDWYRMSPEERFAESQKLWEVFLLFGGSYDPEPDSQSPFYFEDREGRPDPQY